MTDPADPFDALNNEEVRVLPPDYSLKKIIGHDVDLKKIFSAENVEKAQQVINDHKDSFLEWVMKDIQTLEECYARAQSNLAASDPEIRKLAKAAFIIKSQAGTFGFTLATLVAKSLDDFCNQHFRATPGHMTVIAKHIDTLKVIFQKNITGDGEDLGKELSQSLFQLIAKFKDNQA
jgi:HPt (histidine-containing phosphotransfer) domain-containing protein